MSSTHPTGFERFWTYLKHTWAGNLARITGRTLTCQQCNRPPIKWHTELRMRIRNSTNNQCYYCRVTFDSNGAPTSMQVDHYWPWSKGGSNELANLVPACRTCNLRKKDYPPWVFARRYRYSVKPFCRHKALDQFCTNQPRLGHKYCRHHQLFPCIGTES